MDFGTIGGVATRLASLKDEIIRCEIGAVLINNPDDHIRKADQGVAHLILKGQISHGRSPCPEPDHVDALFKIGDLIKIVASAEYKQISAIAAKQLIAVPAPCNTVIAVAATQQIARIIAAHGVIPVSYTHSSLPKRVPAELT